MKQIILFLIVITAFSLNLRSQVVSADEMPILHSESVNPTDTVVKSADQDTAIVRIGKKNITIIDHEDETESICRKDKHKKNDPDKFDGHWEGVEFGFNGFDKPNYGMYNGNEFMSLNQGKSMEFNLNFYELNISLAKSYVGLVSGMGLSFNNYRFENPYTLRRGTNITEPVLLNAENLSKSKLAVSYVNVPLLLEFQIPVNHKEGRLFVNAGLVGGVKIGSHTKVKQGGTKDKDRSGFNLNQFKYAATGRIGYKDIGIFATYSLTPLFQSGKGPELTPFTVGISFLD